MVDWQWDSRQVTPPQQPATPPQQAPMPENSFLCWAQPQHYALSSAFFPTKNPEASGVYTNHKPLSGSCIYKLRRVEIKGDTT